jgi:hypothetical protein
MSGIVFLESSFRVFVPLEKDYARLTGSFKKHFPDMKFSAKLHAKGIHLGYYWTFSFRNITEMNAFVRMYNIPENDELEEESKVENMA